MLSVSKSCFIEILQNSLGMARVMHIRSYPQVTKFNIVRWQEKYHVLLRDKVTYSNSHQNISFPLSNVDILTHLLLLLGAPGGTIFALEESTRSSGGNSENTRSMWRERDRRHKYLQSRRLHVPKTRGATFSRARARDLPESNKGKRRAARRAEPCDLLSRGKPADSLE